MLPTTALKAQKHSTPRQAGPRFLQVRSDADQTSLRREIHDGLLRPQAQLSPKFFYDVLGSHLFEAITLLDEYYPTRTELGILRDRGSEIAADTAQRSTTSTSGSSGSG